MKLVILLTVANTVGALSIPLILGTGNGTGADGAAKAILNAGYLSIPLLLIGAVAIKLCYKQRKASSWFFYLGFLNLLICGAVLALSPITVGLVLADLGLF